MPDRGRSRWPPAVLRLLPGGLRWRLTAWVAVVLTLALAITFAAIYRGTGTQLRAQIDRQLHAAADGLLHRMQARAGDTPARLAAAGSVYVRALPFSVSSRVLYARVPGQPTVTNDPELLALRGPEHDEHPAAQRSEDRVSGDLFAAPTGYSTLTIPDVGPLRLLTRDVVSPAGNVVARVGAGAPLSSVRVAQGGVARAFVLAGLISLALALLASYLVGDRVSRPLRGMARVAARVDGGDLAPRIRAPGASDSEVRVLADAFDRMLDRLQDAFARQRSFVADASHELRTPLTVVRGQMELLARDAHPSPEEVRRVERLVQAEVARMSRLVDDLLLLAHSDEAQFVRAETVSLDRYLGELWAGVTQTADRAFELGELPSGTLRADPDRLAQALRNLLRNAVEHTAPRAGRVRLSAAQDSPGWVTFAVEDDGPGIPPEQRDRVFDRFHRTDAARSRSAGGTGLGLAIVAAIAVAHGGSARARSSAVLGGARLELTLPGFSAAGLASPPELPVASAAPPARV